jgi:hypothetical protein
LAQGNDYYLEGLGGSVIRGLVFMVLSVFSLGLHWSCLVFETIDAQGHGLVGFSGGGGGGGGGGLARCFDVSWCSFIVELHSQAWMMLVAYAAAGISSY